MAREPGDTDEKDSVSAASSPMTLLAPSTPVAPVTPMTRLLQRALQASGGWLPFDRFMALALYAPGLGYYSRGSRQFGAMPASGSDFVTAPEQIGRAHV